MSIPARVRFALTSVFCATLVVSAGLARAETRPPNIVLIMADDMGYECVGANGGTSYETPHLDRLAKEGARFTQCYSQPICTPSRVQLMTGIYNKRNYIRFGILDPAATTFAHVLKQAGYATCVAGKWQLLGGVNGPQRFGFDTHSLWQLTVRESRYPNPALEIDGETVRYRKGEYGPDLVTDHIVQFIETNRNRPFLVYYPMILPHWPFEPTPDGADWEPKAEGVLKGKGKNRYFADMVKYTDKMVGKVVAAIDKAGLAENTLVLFTCDNGTAVGIRSMLDGRTVHGAKGSTTDAGTRVPFVARWKGVTKPGVVSHDLVDFSDFFPSLLDAAGVEVPAGLPLDGRSFVPQLRGERGEPRDWIHCWYARNGGPVGQEFARDQTYKLYADSRFYRVPSDFEEKQPLDLSTLDAEAKAAHTKLAAVVARYRDARRIPIDRLRDDKDIEAAAKEIKARGAHVFAKDGKYVEVNANDRPISGETMGLIGGLFDLTDLSLERCPVEDDGLAKLKNLQRLEWLNLFQTRIGNKGLKALTHLRGLRHLPIGATRVNDKGLKHLRAMPPLEYLGLRGNDVGDAGLEHVAMLTSLEALHLGETRVTSAGMARLASLSRLKKLWLSQTGVDDAAIVHLSKLTSLRELFVDGTAITSAGMEKLRAALPECAIR